VGVHTDLESAARNLHVVPNLDAGFGGSSNIVTATADLIYLPPAEHGGTFYFGGSLGFAFWHSESYDRFPGAEGREGTGRTSGLDGGAAGILGLRFPFREQEYYLDLKTGVAGHCPEFKLMLGTTFGGESVPAAPGLKP